MSADVAMALSLLIVVATLAGALSLLIGDVFEEKAPHSASIKSSYSAEERDASVKSVYEARSAEEQMIDGMDLPMHEKIALKNRLMESFIQKIGK